MLLIRTQFRCSDGLPVSKRFFDFFCERLLFPPPALSYFLHPDKMRNPEAISRKWSR
jgi:hypothetical protein